MKSLLLIVFSFSLLSISFVSCQKEQNVSDVNIKNTTAINQQVTTLKKYSSIKNTLLSNGGALDNSYVPSNSSSVSGYSRIESYKISGTNQVYVLYIFDSENIYQLIQETKKCTKAWHSGSGSPDNPKDWGCYDEGSECDVELRNGEFKILCCDDEEVPLA